MPTYQQVVIGLAPQFYLPCQDWNLGVGNPTEVMGHYTPTLTGGAGTDFLNDPAGPTINLATNRGYKCGAIGTTNRIAMNAAAILGGSNGWGIAVWMKTASVATYYIYQERSAAGNDLMGMSSVGGPVGPVMKDDAGTLTYNVVNGGSVVGSLVPMTITDNLWHFVVVVWDSPNGRMHLYKDGTDVCSYAKSVGQTNNFTDAGMLATAFWDRGAVNEFQGSIAHLAGWTRPLTGADVSTMWNNSQAAAGGAGAGGLRFHSAIR